jgi:uncharacterized glyoxalase superfamily protein PhnB
MTGNLPKLDGSATIFVVEDLLKSLEHYMGVFGFAKAFVYGEPAMYAGVERDGVIIHLQAAQRTTRKPGNGAIYIFAGNVDLIFDEIQSKGARIDQPPRDYPYGMRDFSAFDPDGNQLSFGQEVKR